MPTVREKLAGKKTKLSRSRPNDTDHPASLDNFEAGNFYQVDINRIHPDPDQPRKYFDEAALAELADSIGQRGVLQPVLIRKEAGGKVYLVAGERRYRAARMAGLDRIPAILTTGKPAEIALIENLQRENLKPMEEAEALGRMLADHQYTQEQLARVIGKAQSTISETLSLNRLPATIKDKYRLAEYPRRLLVEIAKQKTEGQMLKLFGKIKLENLKSRDVRKITRRRKTGKTSNNIAAALRKTRELSRLVGELKATAVSGNDKIKLINEFKLLIDILGDFAK